MKQVLLIQPDEEDARLLNGFLASFGHEVTEVCDGVGALDVLSCSSPPDVVLCATRLPDFDVTNLLQVLQERLPKALLLPCRSIDDDRVVWSWGTLERPFCYGALKDALEV